MLMEHCWNQALDAVNLYPPSPTKLKKSRKLSTRMTLGFKVRGIFLWWFFLLTLDCFMATCISREERFDDFTATCRSREEQKKLETIKTPAMDPGYEDVISDFRTFVNGKKFYKRKGKTWKRGYLLYEPPGSEGASLIAAMADFLEFNLYNLDLASFSSFSELKHTLLVGTSSSSVIAIHDLDDFDHCAGSGMLPNLNNELKGPCLLEFVNGLLSSCGDEQIIVFTTTNRDRHDAARRHCFNEDIYVHKSSPQPVALADEGEIVQLDSSRQKPLVDFGATNIKAYQGSLLVSNSEEKNTREASARRCMTESVCSFVDSMTSISSTDFDALDNIAHLGKAYQSGPIVFSSEKKDTSGPIVFSSEKKDTREGLSGEWLTKSALSFDDSTKCKSFPFDVNLSSFSEHASQDFDDFDFVGFDYGAGMLPNLKDELDSSREKSLVDFDAPNIKAHGLLVSNSEEKNTGEASTRRFMTESVCSLVDSMPSISSTDFDALDNISHLGRAYQSGPIVSNSEQKDTREGLSGQWLTKSSPSFDDKQKLLPYCTILASSLELTSQDLYDINDFDGFDHCAGRLPNLEDESDIVLPDGGHILSLSEKKIVRKTLKRKCRTMGVLSLEDHQHHVGWRWEDVVKFLGAKRSCRQLAIHCETKVKRIHRQLGTLRWPFKQTAISLSDGGHILSLSEKKIVRKTLKRKCRIMCVLSLEDHKQHVDGRWEDAAKSHGAIHTTQKSFRVLETLPTREQPYDCVPLLSLGRLSHPKEEKSPDMPRVMQIKGVEQSATKFPKYIGGLTTQSASSSCWPIGLPDGGHHVLLDPLEQSTKNVAHVARADQCSPTVALPKKKMLRRTLKKKCRLMSTRFEIHQQHFGRKYEGSAKSFGAARICRKHGINRVSTVKRIHDQYGIRQWPFRQKWATRKGYSLRDKRPLEVSSLSMDEILGSRFPFIHMSQFARSLPRRLALQDGSNVVEPIALSSSDFAATTNREHHVRKDQSGSTASLYERKNTRETSDRRGIIMSLCRVENLQQHFGCIHKDAVNRLGGNVSMFKSTCGQHRVWWPCRIKSNDSLAWKSIEILDSLPLSENKMVRKTLKRKCKTMILLSSEDHQQHVDKRWDDPAKSHGAKHICRQVVLPRVTIAMRIHRQHGIHRWPLQQDRATAKGYSLEGQRPVEVISLYMGWKLVSRLQLIYLSWRVRYSPRSSALSGAGEIVGRIALSSSEFAATNNRADLIIQDQSGSTASHSRTIEQEKQQKAKGKGIKSTISLEDLCQRFGLKRKDAAKSLGVSISTLKRVRSKHGITRWPNQIGSNAVWRPPDQHGEKNPPLTCKTLSTNGQTEMENEMVGHHAEMNEFVLYFDDGPNEAGVSSEWASQLRNQFPVSTAHPNSSGLVVPHPHMASQILGENMGSLEDWSSFASLEEPLLPSNDSGSMSTVPPCSYPVPSQPMPTIPHTFLGSSEDRRNSPAFLEDVFPEGHISGSLLASVEDVSLEEHVHTTGSSDDLRNLLASAEEPFSAGQVSGSVRWTGPSCSDPALSQLMPTIPHTMPTIPRMMPLPMERQDAGFVKLRATYEDTTIKFNLPLTSGISELNKEVLKRLEFELGRFRVEYEDEDGVLILIACDDDVREYLQFLASSGNQVFKPLVLKKVPNTTNVCETCESLKRKRLKQKRLKRKGQ